MCSANELMEQLDLLKPQKLTTKYVLLLFYYTMVQLMKYPGILVEHCDILVTHLPSMTE